MARLPYVMESGVANPDLKSLYDEISRVQGSVLNLYRILGNQPAALRAFMTMSRYVRHQSPLRPQLRELAVLVTATVLEVDYERVHHLAAARKAGIPEPKLRDIPTWRTSTLYAPVERAVSSTWPSRSGGTISTPSSSYRWAWTSKRDCPRPDAVRHRGRCTTPSPHRLTPRAPSA
ncbi:MAG: carboxymuconolactone decarboxylase family protein [Bacillati bacterium ANGP1]|uniref:Carboxymuconolactone decarboxylase family protein n=1 Tax=Candidatus Segetimicrobium genomatis TaxID=2569760 RepID=A0A537LQ53_9BACT|nr:MAG: carboxymuconolactone decarboxylase family protein [Terrabacteria group bacterium ANGP1]